MNEKDKKKKKQSRKNMSIVSLKYNQFPQYIRMVIKFKYYGPTATKAKSSE